MMTNRQPGRRDQPGPARCCFYWEHSELWSIRLSHEEAMGSVSVLSALSHTGCEGLPRPSTLPVGVGGGEKQSQHGDPNNTDNLDNTAEAIVPRHLHHPPPHTHHYNLLDTVGLSNFYIAVFMCCHCRQASITTDSKITISTLH